MILLMMLDDATEFAYDFIGWIEDLTGELDMKQDCEQLIRQFISDGDECTEENDVMFTAASKFYEITGNKKARKKMEQALEAYDKYLEEMFDMDDYAPDKDYEFGDIFFPDDDDLPFNY